MYIYNNMTCIRAIMVLYLRNKPLEQLASSVGNWDAPRDRKDGISILIPRSRNTSYESRKPLSTTKVSPSFVCYI